MILRKNIVGLFCLLAFSFNIASCDKVDISFGSTTTLDDPNITFFDNYETTIATYKLDSFLTTGHQLLALGYHYDSVFGVIKAASYAQVTMPTGNPVLNIPVGFDSLELVIKPSGQFYGDSTKPMKVNVYRLTQNIKDLVNGDVYYNTASFNYDPSPIGQQTISLNGKTNTAIHIRLSDALGQEWLTKLKNGHDDFSSADKFVDYFKGIYINTDSTVTKSVAFFSAPSDSMFIRLSYHENTIYPTQKTIDFTYLKEKQFNNISMRYTNSNFSTVVNKKAQLIESAASGNRSFLNTSAGMSLKISFPTLLNLKELHPYIKVVKAVLVIKPDVRSYTFPYQLPAALNLYATDQTNYPGSGIFDASGGSSLQTGNLVIDNLYGENTYYSYDITSFINTKISEGQFSNSALLLQTTLTSQDAGLQRLIVNNQTNSRSVQLKLYVLGL